MLTAGVIKSVHEATLTTSFSCITLLALLEVWFCVFEYM